MRPRLPQVYCPATLCCSPTLGCSDFNAALVTFIHDMYQEALINQHWVRAGGLLLP